MKMISYAERMAKKSNSYVGEYDPVYEINQVENYSENGRVLKRNVVVSKDNREVMAQYSPDDFRIENLAAVGALQDTKRYTLNPSTMDMYDAVGEGFDVLTDIVDNNNNNSNND